MALDALDLLLVADCAWIWVRSKIRDPPEASTRRDHPCLCSAVSPHSNDGFHGVPQRRVGFFSLLSSSTTWVLRTALSVDVSCGKDEAFFCHQVTCFEEFRTPSVSAFSLSSALTWACFVDVLRGVSQAIPSMPARSHFGEVRLNLPSGYSLGLCFKPVEQEAL
ncbi:hypothetical protein Bca101_026031 [Brassica carinata]